MNARLQTVNGKFRVVQVVPSDKLDQVAALLGLDAAQKAALAKYGDLLVVQSEN